jgi:hypothetical protein
LDTDQQNTGFLKHVENKVKPLAGKTKNQKRKILLLGSCHGREIGPMLKEHLGTECELTSIYKPNAPLANVVEDPGGLGNDLTKQDHIIKVGGPGNSLDRNYHYSIEKDISFMAERSNNMNAGFVNKIWRHDRPWIKRKVRSVTNPRLGCGNSHIHVIETTSVQRKPSRPWPASKFTRHEEAYTSYC